MRRGPARVPLREFAASHRDPLVRHHDLRRGYMPRLLLALAVAGRLTPPGSLAYADDQPDPCVGYAARSAYPSLQYSYQFSPQGYGPWGYAPLTYPFGAGPYGNAALFGIPGPGGMLPLSPSFGP